MSLLEVPNSASCGGRPTRALGTPRLRTVTSRFMRRTRLGQHGARAAPTCHPPRQTATTSMLRIATCGHCRASVLRSAPPSTGVPAPACMSDTRSSRSPTAPPVRSRSKETIAGRVTSRVPVGRRIDNVGSATSADGDRLTVLSTAMNHPRLDGRHMPWNCDRLRRGCFCCG